MQVATFRTRLCGILLLCLVSLSAKAQESPVIIQLDSLTMLVGDQQHLRIGINHRHMDDKIEIHVDSLLNSNWEILSSTPLTHIKTESGYDSYKEFTITSWEQGSQVIPSLSISLTANDLTETFYTDSLSVMIIGPDIGDLKDLKDIYRMPFPMKNLLFIIAGVLAVLLFIYFLYRFLRKRKKQEPLEEKPVFIPPDPPHTIALARLDALSRKHLIEKGQIPQFQSELTHIIRQFLGTTYNFNALESTTTEILEYVRKRQAYTPYVEELGRFLRMADLVKFAKAQPAEEFHRSMLEFGYKTVELLEGDAVRQHNKRYHEFQSEEE